MKGTPAGFTNRVGRELDVTLTVLILLVWTVVIPALVLGAASLGSRRRERLFGAARDRAGQRPRRVTM
jgi:hypothetical protein